MFYRKQNNQTDILKGLQIDEPKIFIPWNIDENDFVNMFKNYTVARNIERYCGVKNITVFGEINCNIVAGFDKTICKFSISRDHCEEDNSLKDKSIKTPEDFKIYLEKSFKNFQIALEKSFGKPSKRIKSLDSFESCEWNIGNKIKIYHYVMDRFGLVEYLHIEKG